MTGHSASKKKWPACAACATVPGVRTLAVSATPTARAPGSSIIRSHDGVLRGFAIYDCCCGLKPQVSEGVVHTAGFDEPMVLPYWPAFREGSALCRDASFAGVSTGSAAP